MFKILAIIIALAACFSRTANANLNHAENMNEATEVISEEVLKIKLPEKDAIRFWQKVDKNGPLPDQSNPHYRGLGRCWQWTAGKFTDGYGIFSIMKKSRRAHHVSFILSLERNPAGEHLCHKCDNSLCVNPSHLFEGTAKQNVSDSIAKGRKPSGEQHWAKRNPSLACKGKDHPATKLTAKKVLSIRSTYETGKFSMEELAESNEIGSSQVFRIIHRKSWRHI